MRVEEGVEWEKRVKGKGSGGGQGEVVERGKAESAHERWGTSRYVEKRVATGGKEMFSRRVQ